MKAYENLVQAESGCIDVTGDGDVGIKVGTSIANISTCRHAHSSVLEALIERGYTCKSPLPFINGPSLL